MPFIGWSIMASKRMFALKIIDSDAFLDMPLTTQATYFHLCMRADDDGFVDNPKKIQRMIRASDDDMRMLMAKQFVIPFDSGIVVIKHWKIHNIIRKDTYSPTIYRQEAEEIEIDSAGTYHRNDTVTATSRQCNGNVTATSQHRLTDKISIDKNSIDNTISINQFEELWSIYPRKQGKKAAEAAYKRAKKDGVDDDEIRRGIEAYRRYIEESGIEPRYVKQGSTFFNQRAWADDWTPRKPRDRNQFNQFEHNNYDFDSLEKEIVGNA